MPYSLNCMRFSYGQNSVCTIPISAVCAIMYALFLHPCMR
eukprot:06726.XXX_76567_76686_1 [CDS] Oithona nana genome sequencing.